MISISIFAQLTKVLKEPNKITTTVLHHKNRLTASTSNVPAGNAKHGALLMATLAHTARPQDINGQGFFSRQGFSRAP